MKQHSRCFPEDFFKTPASFPEQKWTCVQTRPRWEKKFAQWLRAKRISFYLPLYPHRTVSGRKARVTYIPLFPGYVFVIGTHSKQTFTDSGCLVRLIEPRSPGENERLAVDLANIFRMLEIGAHPVVVRKWLPGQRVRVLEGPLKGTLGQFLREADKGCFVVRVDLLGVGAAVVLPCDTPIEAAE